MSDQETRLQAIRELRQALLESETMASKFRAAFPELAPLLAERELSDADLDNVAGGVKRIYVGNLPFSAADE